MTSRTFANPIPDPAIGDPFVLRWRGRFYLYGTNDGPPLEDGRQIPVFVSDDLLHWEPLGGALIPSDPHADHWAPEVLAWNGKFFMMVSFGDVDRTGHALWVAVADRPEGPFTLESRVSDPSEKFSIDGSWLVDDDGSLYLFRCLDFVEEAPFGTGIVVQPMKDPFTPIGPPRTVLRAHSPWQVYETNRTMALYEGKTFEAWTTIEGPAPVKRNGRYYCGYSGGNYTGAYGTGEAVADHPLGPYTDLRGREGPIFATTPGLVEGPGHFSVIQPDGLHDWIVLHGRRPGEHVRRVWLCPANWGPDGVTIGPLTDREQPAPPLPKTLLRFDGSGLEGMTIESGIWSPECGCLEHKRGESEGIAWVGPWIDGPDAVVSAYFRHPEMHPSSAGVLLRGDSRSGELTVFVTVDQDDNRAGVCLVCDRQSGPKFLSTPSLGGLPFDPSAFHQLSIHIRGGLAEVRLDGVVVATDRVVPKAARFGLRAYGSAEFDAVSVTVA